VRRVSRKPFLQLVIDETDSYKRKPGVRYWYLANKATPLTENKEKYRGIVPTELTLDELAASGFSNDLVAEKLRQRIEKNKAKKTASMPSRNIRLNRRDWTEFLDWCKQQR